MDELISLSLELHRSSSTVEKGQENEEELDCLGREGDKSRDRYMMGVG